MECCGVGPMPHAAFVERSISIHSNGKPGFRLTGSRNSWYSSSDVPAGDCTDVAAIRSHWPNHSFHGSAYW